MERRRARAMVWAVLAGVVPVAAVVTGNTAGGAAVDAAPPQLVTLAITPGTLDTSSGPATVTIDARITDDVTGPSTGGRVPLSRVELRGPRGQQTAVAYLTQAQRIAGTPVDGTYRSTVALPWHAEPGRWTATSVLVDVAGNTATKSSAELAAAGLASGVNQVGAGDTTPPALVSLQVSPSTIDTFLAPAGIVVTARVTDDLAGVSSGSGIASSQVVLRGPSGAHRVRAVLTSARRSSGQSLDGTYSVPVTVPRWSEQGRWTVEQVILVDEVGNTQTVGADASFTQTGTGDVVAPRFLNATLSPTSVDVRSGPGSVFVHGRVTDDLSGAAAAGSASEVVFRSPSGQTEVTATFGLAQRTSGTALDGWYDARVSIPAHAEPGAWSVIAAFAIDEARNVATIDPTAWAASGFPSGFTVVSDAPPVTGPTVPPPITSPPTSAGTTTTLAPGATTTTMVASGTTSTTVAGTTTTTAASGTTITSTSSTSTTSTSTTTTGSSTTVTTTAPGTTTPTTVGATSAPPGPGVVAAQPVVSRGRAADGYWFATARHGVAGFGAAASLGVSTMATTAPVTGMAATPTGQGYWVVTADGDVRAFGDARDHGALRGVPLRLPIVGIAATPTGNGYWLVARDGGIFSFGDATFFGSTGDITLNQPVVGMAATPTGRGYWFVAADGGIFAYGDARFFGSTGGIRLNLPVVGMTSTTTGRGYWLVARDGGIFAFGDASFFGSTGSIRLAQPIVGMAATPTGAGYWFVAADGGIFAFGDAGFYGSLGATPPASPVVAMAARTT